MTEASLSLVPGEDTDSASAATSSPTHIPAFEGEEVVTTKAKITSVAGLEVGDRVFRMDESVKLIVDAKVLGVHHVPNAQGKLERIHILKAIDSLVVSWDMDMDALRDALT